MTSPKRLRRNPLVQYADADPHLEPLPRQHEAAVAPVVPRVGGSPRSRGCAGRRLPAGAARVVAPEARRVEWLLRGAGAGRPAVARAAAFDSGTGPCSDGVASRSAAF